MIDEFLRNLAKFYIAQIIFCIVFICTYVKPDLAIFEDILYISNNEFHNVVTFHYIILNSPSTHLPPRIHLRLSRAWQKMFLDPNLPLAYDPAPPKPLLVGLLSLDD